MCELDLNVRSRVKSAHATTACELDLNVRSRVKSAHATTACELDLNVLSKVKSAHATTVCELDLNVLSRVKSAQRQVAAVDERERHADQLRGDVLTLGETPRVRVDRQRRHELEPKM